jgi:hypothetical protein
MNSRKRRTQPSAAQKRRGQRSPRNKHAAPRTPEQHFAKSERDKDTWGRVVEVIRRMRSQKVSLNRASREVGISPHTVVRWGGAALRKRANGRYTAKAKDHLLRALRILTPEGRGEILLRGSEQATQLAEYWNAVDRYRDTGDSSRLDSYRGQYIKDANGTPVPLLTDHAAIDLLGSAGLLSFESIYTRSV